jgi:hypothetical protein
MFLVLAIKALAALMKQDSFAALFLPRLTTSAGIGGKGIGTNLGVDGLAVAAADNEGGGGERCLWWGLARGAHFFFVVCW